nr:reverse transcriptase domain-containing protein [Tanacetum cinerariifolium]
MVPATTPLVGFSGEIIWPLGHSTSAWINFMVVRSPSPYNGIIGRPGPVDMTSIPRHIAEHRLNIHEGYQPVRQKKRGKTHERNKPIHEEVEKLVNAGIMKEVHYHSWLSNPVMVKKHDDGWRMCVEFMVLNKACLKDGYPLPKIYWKIAELPMLTAPKEKEELIIYLAAAKEAINAVQMTERDGKQVPIYFVSRAFQGPEINYNLMEKLILALNFIMVHIVFFDQPRPPERCVLIHVIEQGSTRWSYVRGVWLKGSTKSGRFCFNAVGKWVSKVLSTNGTRVLGQVSNLVPDLLLHRGNIEVHAIVFVHELVLKLLDVDEDMGLAFVDTFEWKGLIVHYVNLLCSLGSYECTSGIPYR